MKATGHGWALGAGGRLWAVIALCAVAALIAFACDTGDDEDEPDAPEVTTTPVTAGTPRPDETATETPEAAETVRLAPGIDLQEEIDRHPPGTTFILESGIHRLAQIEPRDGDTYIGEQGTILNGARILDEFERDDDYWVANGQEQHQDEAGDCDEGPDGERQDACVHAEQLFIDGDPLRQVTDLDDVEEGTWYFDYDDDEIYFADDPEGRLVETSVVSAAFHGDAEDVTITGLVIEKYANRAQRGAIEGGESRGWVVTRNEIRLNHGTGLRVGDEMIVRGNHVHHNGQLGIGGIGDSVLVEGNEISYNNTAWFHAGWEGGGTKFVHTRDLVVRDNWVHHNRGPGLWTDIDNSDVLMEDNLVEWNDERGIVHEIGYAAVIRNNVTRFNGLEFDTWLWGAQILVQNSSDVEVYGNLAVVHPDGGDGISVINQDRGEGREGEWVSQNVSVRENEIVYLGTKGQSGIADDTDDRFSCSSESGNEFIANHYRVQANERHWEWCSQLGWDDFQERAGSAGELTEMEDSSVEAYMSGRLP